MWDVIVSLPYQVNTHVYFHRPRSHGRGPHGSIVPGGVGVMRLRRFLWCGQSGQGCPGRAREAGEAECGDPTHHQDRPTRLQGAWRGWRGVMMTRIRLHVLVMPHPADSPRFLYASCVVRGCASPPAPDLTMESLRGAPPFLTFCTLRGRPSARCLSFFAPPS
jgi:hypothetical protein